MLLLSGLGMYVISIRRLSGGWLQTGWLQTKMTLPSMKCLCNYFNLQVNKSRLYCFLRAFISHVRPLFVFAKSVIESVCQDNNENNKPFSITELVKTVVCSQCLPFSVPFDIKWIPFIECRFLKVLYS